MRKKMQKTDQKVFVINAFTQKVEAIFLDNLNKNYKEMIEMAREYPNVVGEIEGNVLIKLINNTSLSFSIYGEVYHGGIFILASSIDVQDCSLSHLPLYRQISFQTSLAKEIIKLAKSDYYKLDDCVSVSLNQSISIRDFIKQASKLNSYKQIEMYRVLYSANHSMEEDKIYTINHFMRQYAF